MENDVSALFPISIAWPRQQLARNSNCCSTRNPVSFLNSALIITPAHQRGAGANPCHLWLTLPRQKRADVCQQFVCTNRTIPVLLHEPIHNLIDPSELIRIR